MTILASLIVASALTGSIYLSPEPSNKFVPEAFISSYSIAPAIKKPHLPDTFFQYPQLFCDILYFEFAGSSPSGAVTVFTDKGKLICTPGELPKLEKDK